MKNYRFLFVLSILAILIVLFNSCCKKRTCPDISSDERQWIPYKNNDTLIFKNFEIDSVLKFRVYNYREEELDKKDPGEFCFSSCLSGIQVNLRTIEVDDVLESPFFLEKSDSDIFVLWSVSGLSSGIEEKPSIHALFDLRRSSLIEEIEIANQDLQNVYEFITDSTHNRGVRKTYVKKGMGLVKIVFNDDQQYELINHIKNEK
ncbi:MULTISPECIES: hypothetical protein [unclassified Lentimicrobium]|uniref:hypothetical protein n=1 Tax=unclassified Lentimicrobium TaxID=2677434 RepID=UPI001553B3D2|nr:MULTISPECIES: hypothetical protein [unclassified Lentimicrobium]NPD48225.1 hypothetical protein [Lentimicrobium sp. S6]NPD86913.1 hypothetical protein [Lentimicrobium sp. L6]